MKYKYTKKENKDFAFILRNFLMGNIDAIVKWAEKEIKNRKIK